ncbi:hypothetical protein [endosymbiont of Acanthamoeba sp. UWC8]|nr:hypothetical protein [endosymbiont of Acanthamoeba sp. UWC8]
MKYLIKNKKIVREAENPVIENICCLSFSKQYNTQDLSALLNAVIN